MMNLFRDAIWICEATKQNWMRKETKSRHPAVMRSTVFKSQHCSVARTLELVGEWWTLLIVREAFFGTRRFSDFERNLGVAKNVLSSRLAKLVEQGLMQRRAAAGRGNPVDYVLTRKGEELFPVIVALMQWGDRWIYGPGRAPVSLVHRAHGKAIARLDILGADGARLAMADVGVLPGPGANDAIRRRFAPPASRGAPRSR